MINLSQMLMWPIRPYSVFLCQILSYLDQLQQRYGGKEVGEFSVMLYEEIGWCMVGILLPANMATAILMYGDCLNIELP